MFLGIAPFVSTPNAKPRVVSYLFLNGLMSRGCGDCGT
jgi:hypothetical protein